MSAAEHWIKGGNAVCLGDESSDCHNYPDCECDFWDVDEITGEHIHPKVPQDECWMVPWLDDMRDSVYDEALDRRDPVTHAFPDGQIVLEWEDEGVIWNYADEVTS